MSGRIQQRLGVLAERAGLNPTNDTIASHGPASSHPATPLSVSVLCPPGEAPHSLLLALPLLASSTFCTQHRHSSLGSSEPAPALLPLPTPTTPRARAALTLALIHTNTVKQTRVMVGDKRLDGEANLLRFLSRLPCTSPGLAELYEASPALARVDMVLDSLAANRRYNALKSTEL